MSQTLQQTIECPYCAEQINPRAKKCKYCGEILDPQMREIEHLKREKQNLIVNNNNNNNNSGGGKSNFSHGFHLVMSLITMGLWVPIWLILYICRDKNRYY